MGLTGSLRGFCIVVLASAAIPLSVLVAVLLETPRVIELGPSGQTVGGADDDGGAGGNAAMVAAARFGSIGLFDSIAHAYDAANSVMSLGLDRRWRQLLVEDCLKLERDDRVLDLAAGTVEVGLLVGRRLRELGAAERSGGGTAPVLGLDRSGEMLLLGAEKIQAAGLEGVIDLARGDAEDLTQLGDLDGIAAGEGLKDDSVDKIAVGFGIRHMADRPRALREMRRVLRRRPSSRVCVLEVSLPTGDGVLSRLSRDFIQWLLPVLGGAVAELGAVAAGAVGGSAADAGAEDEFRGLARFMLEFPEPRAFAALMASEGLPVQRITSFAYGSVHLYEAALS